MKGNIGKLIILGIGFQLLFSVFITAQNLAPQVLDDLGFGSMGFYSLAVLYLMFSVSCFVATPIVNKCGERFSMVVGSMNYALYTGSFILASAQGHFPESIDSWYMDDNFIKFVIMFTAACCGFGAAILWVGQGRYISRIANDANKGTYNSIFWAFFMSAMIVGTLFGALVLKHTDSFTFYCAMTIVSVLASLFFLFLRPVHPNQVTDTAAAAEP